MVSFGHPVHHQDAKEKPLQTQKKTHKKKIIDMTNNDRAIIIRESTVRHHKYTSTMKKYIKYINMNMNIERIYKEFELKTIRK